jgi:hypothetical protein
MEHTLAVRGHGINTRGDQAMYIGQFVMVGVVTYSPWFPRGADKGTFLCELISKSATGTLDIDVQHKNRTDNDAAAAVAGSFTQITSTGVATKEITAGFKELVRFKFTVGTGGATDDWVIFQMLDTAWRRN